ncbi:hypothetical protein CcI156_10660 [Frankia sp. CcI156]|nr:hypothetical protein CcI156_10660 [Frankia sp. CcI156]
MCIEDNTLDKRSSLYPGERDLASVEEQEKRLRATRRGLEPSCFLITRTGALVAGHGVAEALNRANRYVDAGADAVFVQATRPDRAPRGGVLTGEHKGHNMIHNALRRR